MNEDIDFHEDDIEDEEASPESTFLEERETKVKEKARLLTSEERDEIIHRYNAEHSIHPIPADAVNRPEESGMSMTDLEDSIDEEHQLEGRRTKVKDCKEHPLTAEERDDIIREYNAEYSIHRTNSEEVKEMVRPENNVVISEESNESEKESRYIELSNRIFDSEEIYNLYYGKRMTLKEIGQMYGFKSGKAIRRVLEVKGWKPRPSGNQRIELDQDEVYRLYHEEGWTHEDIARYFGIKSTTPVRTVFERNNWKTRQTEAHETVIEPKEVIRLYFEEKWSQQDIAVYYGVSTGPIRKIFNEQGRECRTSAIEIEPSMIYRLYFDEMLSIDEIAEHFGVSKKPIRRIFREQGWIARPSTVEISSSEVHRLYFEEDYSQLQIAKHLGCSIKPIRRIFEEQGWDVRPSKMEFDFDVVYKLYYEENKTMKEVAEHLGISEKPLRQFFREQNWEKRRAKTIVEIRDELFGKECIICNKPRDVIHKKDGVPHSQRTLWSRKLLQSLNPKDWAALCYSCHLMTHSLMREFGYSWNEIEPILNTIANNSKKENE